MPLSLSPHLCFTVYVHFVEEMFARVSPSLLYLARKSLLFDAIVHIIVNSDYLFTVLI
jgi:membrane protease YdiL (CAAX protease family)